MKPRARARDELASLQKEKECWLELEAENEELKKRLFISEKKWLWTDDYLSMSMDMLKALWIGAQGGGIRGIPGSGKTHEEIVAEKHEEELKFWEDKIFGVTDLDGSLRAYKLQKEFPQDGRKIRK